MRTEATLEEWKDLYYIAIRLKEIKPWEELWDMDLITILPYGKDEPSICSVMGRGGECFGIGAYIGINAIHNFFVMANSQDVPSHQLIRYQNNVMCYFGNRDELTKKDLDIIKKLDLKFRGKNNWIYFRRFDTKYAPYLPDRSEVLELTDILKHLYMAIEALHKGVKIDFENGKTLMRRFHEQSNLWINYEMPLFIPKVQYPVPKLEDQLLVKRLKKQPLNNSILELDIAYLNSTINDRSFDKPFIQRLCVLADKRNGMVLSHVMVTPKDDEVNIVFGTIINYVLEREKPKQIIVRDAYIFSILIDLCKQVGIDIIQSGQLQAIDEFVESFNKYIRF